MRLWLTIDPMNTVAFITTEADKDLIVSFALVASHDPEEIESLTLLRTPIFEIFLDEIGTRTLWN